MMGALVIAAAAAGQPAHALARRRALQEAYLDAFPGYYQTGDAGVVDDDGYVYVMSRTDDIINVAGHRLSTGAMEEVLAAHPDVAECAVIGVHDQLKGQVPLGFVVLKSGVARPEADIVKELVAMVREKIGPVAAFKNARVVKRLPKTRSGKILRGTMRKIADGEPYNMPRDHRRPGDPRRDGRGAQAHRVREKDGVGPARTHHGPRFAPGRLPRAVLFTATGPGPCNRMSGFQVNC